MDGTLKASVRTCRVINYVRQTPSVYVRAIYIEHVACEIALLAEWETKHTSLFLYVDVAVREKHHVFNDDFFMVPRRIRMLYRIIVYYFGREIAVVVIGDKVANGGIGKEIIKKFQSVSVVDVDVDGVIIHHVLIYFDKRTGLVEIDGRQVPSHVVGSDERAEIIGLMILTHTVNYIVMDDCTVTDTQRIDAPTVVHEYTVVIII